MLLFRLLLKSNEEVEEVILYPLLETKPEALDDNDFEISVLLLMLIMHLTCSI